jgi:hypothetical protein
MNNQEKKPAKYTVTLIHDPETGDLILPFPEEVWREMVLKHGWAEGDTVYWKEAKQGSWILSKHKPRPARRRK